ncbi:unnamed protein product [Aphanomyces euteiches]
MGYHLPDDEVRDDMKNSSYVASLKRKVVASTEKTGDKPRALSKKGKVLPAAVWCTESVAALFRLRYNSHISFRFNSKNNNQKGLAFSMLASELCTDIRRTFTAKQVQEKLSRLKSEWACSTPKKQKPTGNDVLQPPPAYFDLMQEYWGSKHIY